MFDNYGKTELCKNGWLVVEPPKMKSDSVSSPKGGLKTLEADNHLFALTVLVGNKEIPAGAKVFFQSKLLREASGAFLNQKFLLDSNKEAVLVPDSFVVYFAQ